MPYTKEQLDQMLGEPTFTEACPYAHCRRVVGPYYKERLAMSAMDDHIEWIHKMVPIGYVNAYEARKKMRL